MNDLNANFIVSKRLPPFIFELAMEKNLKNATTTNDNFKILVHCLAL